MTQIDPRAPTGAPVPSDDRRHTPRRVERGFNWRVSVGLFVGLAVLFGVLFGLRALHIFPAEPGQDVEIASARATQSALATRQVAAQPTVGVASTPASAPVATPTVAPPNSAVQPAATATAVAVQPAGHLRRQPFKRLHPYQSRRRCQSVHQLLLRRHAPTGGPTPQPNPTGVQPEPTPVQAGRPGRPSRRDRAGLFQLLDGQSINAMRDPDDDESI